MWKYILATVLAVIVAVIIIVIAKKKKNRKAGRLNAAAILLREVHLDDVISRDKTSEMERIRPVLELSWKYDRRQSYLFDPISPIRVGRDPNRNQICIRKDSVGAEHCILVMYNGALTVQDLDSRNGTFIKRGHKRYRVNGRVYVKNGDRLEVGGLSMKINLFMFDSAYI